MQFVAQGDVAADLEALGGGSLSGEDAIADGIVVLAEMDAGTMVEIDRDGPDGGSGLQPLLMVENVTPEELENPENFIF
ncbi:hypothetical protein [Lyngbya sp. CCY1209]|uniref:hypothetical protein n=1 Tax=Lyngbya sp. CCY1209 TaxID=2886103 RepID=UPI002D1FDB9F|nr:hypothetical protein [Lyngbya sp. CCY1209]MEB3885346.1 hypothetical protein [Lyngbya sp. CCY1209]